MSQNGIFQEESDDIVTLAASSGNQERTGWVNVGVHAVYIQLSASGDLILSVEPRGNEGRALGTVKVSKGQIVNAGGIDPDE